MNNKINFIYLENYSHIVAEKICSEYFRTKKYMTGQEMIQLTPSQQVNLLIIKSLFTAWQDELEKIKNNPYFDYRDIAVDNSLKEFMNVLSRAIKVEKLHFEPLLRAAVEDAILLALDPVAFYMHLIEESKGDTNYFKDSKKYIKWHANLMAALINKAGMGGSISELKMVLRAHFEKEKDALESPKRLLESLDSYIKIDYTMLLEHPKLKVPEEHKESAPEEERTLFIPEEEDQITPIEDKEPSKPKPQHTPATPANAIDPALAWARFESEEYIIMKGSVGDLSESVGINQRFMFTRELFQGNADLMKHALKSIDQCDSFVEAIELINKRFVGELNWNKESDAVDEFLQLVFRRFEHK